MQNGAGIVRQMICVSVQTVSAPSKRMISCIFCFRAEEQIFKDSCRASERRNAGGILNLPAELQILGWVLRLKLHCPSKCSSVIASKSRLQQFCGSPPLHSQSDHVVNWSGKVIRTKINPQKWKTKPRLASTK